MATTFIDYKDDKGFYIAETFMQLVTHYIYEEAKKEQYIFSNKEDILEDMEWDINGIHAGYLVLMWHEYFNGAPDEQVMLQVLGNVKKTLQNKGPQISVAELMSIKTEDHVLKYILDKKPFPTAELIRVIDALIQMLEGTWESTNYDMDLNWRY
ncbi:hypothetical protein [Sphingobacterium sp. DR205]|uniref:hypothetical protein n=1 Tax=Sphingobacterium sp. DR205 TaxID=2713573 RepID=UPI0013E4B5F3|nr:hypothetical protein [Sphingobacterium sp. DR205]QIH35521.1 hypothetical protein G6053_22750 [Sphingobacterium sp. DR205]